MNVWRRALFTWVAMAVVATLNGIFRETVLVPRWTEFQAGAASAASGIALLQVVAATSLRRTRPLSLAERAQLAALWLLLTLTFEFTFGHYVDHKSWNELLANYNVARGRLWPVVLASIAAAPFLWGGKRTASVPSSDQSAVHFPLEQRHDA